MKILIKEKLSENKYKTPEGYLICENSILARTGEQEYNKSDFPNLFGEETDEIIKVYRPEKEVFNEKTLASFENKPITIEHPDNNVTPENYNDLSVGFARNIHKGKYNGIPVMLGTLVVTDKEAIRLIEEKELTDLSCGYTSDFVKENDKYIQTNIRGNHIALCSQGRAGIAHVQDSLDERETDLNKAITDETETVVLYDRMLKSKDYTEEEKAIIKEIRNDEIDHLNKLTAIIKIKDETPTEEAEKGLKNELDKQKILDVLKVIKKVHK